MIENTHGSGHPAFGDLTNVLCKWPALSDLKKGLGGIKIRRIEKESEPRKEYDENIKTGGRGKGLIFGHLFDWVAKGNYERPSVFRRTKLQHMAAVAAELRSKEATELRNNCVCKWTHLFSAIKSWILHWNKKLAVKRMMIMK
jgi:hypothetical protein